MIITYMGKQFFKIQQGDLVFALNPISKDSKLSTKTSRFGATIALSTTNHPDYNGFDMVSHGDTVPFEIRGPGDYEVKDIFVKGILTETNLSSKKYINTIYSLSIENISICFLGCISNGKLSAEVRGQIDPLDILNKIFSKQRCGEILLSKSPLSNVHIIILYGFFNVVSTFA